MADPIIVFDSTGKYLRSFGADQNFANAHRLRIDCYDNVWVTDNGNRRVMKYTNDGELLMSLGIKGRAGVTDETFRARRHRLRAERRALRRRRLRQQPRRQIRLGGQVHVKAWGKPGSCPGEFDLVHSIAVDSAGRVYASDRENNRIQIFDADGNLLKMWTHLGATQNIYITPDDDVWVITHRDNVENVTYDTLAGRIMRVDIDTLEIIGAMESPATGSTSPTPARSSSAASPATSSAGTRTGWRPRKRRRPSGLMDGRNPRRGKLTQTTLSTRRGGTDPGRLLRVHPAVFPDAVPAAHFGTKAWVTHG